MLIIFVPVFMNQKNLRSIIDSVLVEKSLRMSFGALMDLLESGKKLRICPFKKKFLNFVPVLWIQKGR